MIIYNVILTKIESTHDNLRTNEVKGQTTALPEVGKSLCLVGESLTPENTHRWVFTTEIKNVEKIGKERFVFKTLNSTYQLEVLSSEEIE